MNKIFDVYGNLERGQLIVENIVKKTNRENKAAIVGRFNYLNPTLDINESSEIVHYVPLSEIKDERLSSEMADFIIEINVFNAKKFERIVNTEENEFETIPRTTQNCIMTLLTDKGTKIRSIPYTLASDATVAPVEVTFSLNPIFGKSLKKIEIPLGVVSILPHCFNSVTSNKFDVVFPKTLETIGDHAFSQNWENSNKILDLRDCKNLTYINDCAFENCNIHEVKLPNNVRYLRESAFSKCKMPLLDLSNCDKLMVILNECFKDCNIRTLLPSPNVEIVAKGAFLGCPLNNVDFERFKNLKEIGMQSFYNCLDAHVFLPENVQVLFGKSFGPFTHIHINPKSKYLTQDKDTGAIFSNNGKNLIWIPRDTKEFTIPKDVETLDYDCFADCKNLKSLTFNDNIKDVKEWSKTDKHFRPSERFLDPVSFFYPSENILEGSALNFISYYAKRDFRDEQAGLAIDEIFSLSDIAKAINIVSIIRDDKNINFTFTDKEDKSKTFKADCLTVFALFRQKEREKANSMKDFCIEKIETNKFKNLQLIESLSKHKSKSKDAREL